MCWLYPAKDCDATVQRRSCDACNVRMATWTVEVITNFLTLTVKRWFYALIPAADLTVLLVPALTLLPVATGLGPLPSALAAARLFQRQYGLADVLLDRILTCPQRSAVSACYARYDVYEAAWADHGTLNVGWQRSRSASRRVWSCRLESLSLRPGLLKSAGPSRGGPTVRSGV